MKIDIKVLTYGLFFINLLLGMTNVHADRVEVKSAYIPLADHYAAIVAYEKYRHEMKKADYSIKRMKSWALLRAYFMAGKADMAFVMSPLAMDMFHESPQFRWIGLMHRDGNALAINDLIKEQVNLSPLRQDRLPDNQIADVLGRFRKKNAKPVQCGVPALLSTHSVVLYQYLKNHGKTLGIGYGTDKDVVAIAVPPPKAPAFIKKKNSRNTPAVFEQSLPWADVVETNGYGHVAWYSKDVLKWPNGHVECITLASDDAIENKREAIHEVNQYIHRAGQDIETARLQGGHAMDEIARMVRKHIPEHNKEAIIQSLRLDLAVINYRNLNVDKPGIKYIMDLALEGNILKQPIDINDFADESFAVGNNSDVPLQTAVIAH